MLELRMPTGNFRTLPPPVGNVKTNTFFVKVSDIPVDHLLEWSQINPREINDHGYIFRSIIETIINKPESFALANRGIVISGECFFDDKAKQAVIVMTDNEAHGVLDGVMTLHAILEAQVLEPEACEKAYIQINIKSDLDKDAAYEMSGCLRSSIVSESMEMEALEPWIEKIKNILGSFEHYDDIAFSVEDVGKPVHIMDILYLLEVFNCDRYNADNHPVDLFGNKTALIRNYVLRAGDKAFEDTMCTMVTNIHGLLKTWLLVEKKVADKMKFTSRFFNELSFFDDRVPRGLIMPMIAAFRANLIWNDPNAHHSHAITLKVPNENLIDDCVDALISTVMKSYEYEGENANAVGRNPLVYSFCYYIVTLSIGKLEFEKSLDDLSKVAMDKVKS